jgi:hypothetical protein
MRCAPHWITAGDFTGAGRQDLAVADFYGSVVRILSNDGAGAFAVGNAIAVGANPWYLSAGDLNDDGRDDLATANFYGGVSVLLANGSAFSSAVNYSAGANPTGVVLGDLGGDDKLDLAVSNYGSNNVSVLAGNGDGTFQSAQHFAAGSGPNELTLGYFSGDGRLGIAVANQDGNSASVLLNQTVHGVEGQPFTAAVARFTDANPYASADDFTALISWGDGTTSSAAGLPAGSGELPDGSFKELSTLAGLIVRNADGSFSVHSDHIYAQAGAYTVQVDILDEGGSTASTTLTVQVTEAVLSATGTVTAISLGTPVNGVIARFTDANPNSSASEFQASVDWGDGSPLDTNVTIVADANGGFQVLGDGHVYAAPGAYTVQIQISEAGGGFATATSTVQVSSASAGNLPPALIVPPSMTVNPGGTVTFEVTAIDPDVDALTLSAAGLPSGATFVQTSSAAGSATGTFTWTPAYGQWGNFAPSFSVDDGQGHVVSQNVTLTVLTPQQMLAGFFGQLTRLQAQGLIAAAANAILGNLQGALQNINNNNLPAANAFLNRAQGLIDGLQPQGIPQPVGQPLRLMEEALIGLLVLQMPEPQVGANIQGPTVVPGNSIYDFVVATPYPALPPNYPLNRITWTITDAAGIGMPTAAARIRPEVAGGYRSVGRITESEEGRIVAIYATIQFENVPATVRISLSFESAGGRRYVSPGIIVHIVQLTVTAVPVYESFTLATQPTVRYVRYVRAGRQYIETNSFKAPPAGDGDLRPPAFSFGWGARITATAPDPADYAQIEVGFVQHVTWPQWNATYATGKILTSSVQGRASTLDAGTDQKPFYVSFKRTPNAVAGGGAAWTGHKGSWPFAQNATTLDLFHSDSPAAFVPARFPQLFGDLPLQSQNITFNFNLDVVAKTTQVGFDSALWKQSNTLWSVHYAANFTPPGFFGGFTATYTDTPIVQASASERWVTYTSPAKETANKDSITANDLANNITFS